LEKKMVPDPFLPTNDNSSPKERRNNLTPPYAKAVGSLTKLVKQ